MHEASRCEARWQVCGRGLGAREFPWKRSKQRHVIQQAATCQHAVLHAETRGKAAAAMAAKADLLAATHILQLLREKVRGENDINHLLVVAAVQVPHLAHQLGVNEAIGRDQVVRQGRFAVVHVRQDAYVPNP